MARTFVKLPGLRRVRDEALLSQREIAEQAGVHRVTVTNIENGGPATPATARKLANALGVKPAELMEPHQGGAEKRTEAHLTEQRRRWLRLLLERRKDVVLSDVAQHSGLTLGQVRILVTGDGAIRLEDFQKMAGAFDVEVPAELMEVE